MKARKRNEVQGGSRNMAVGLCVMLLAVAVSIIGYASPGLAVRFGAELGQQMWGIPDMRAATDRVFMYQIPQEVFGMAVENYKITEVDSESLPSWLEFDQSTRTLFGVPMATDAGLYYITVGAVATDKARPTDIFQVEVVASESAAQPESLQVVPAMVGANTVKLAPTTVGANTVKIAPNTVGANTVKLAPTTVGANTVKLAPTTVGANTVKLAPTTVGANTVKLAPTPVGAKTLKLASTPVGPKTVKLAPTPVGAQPESLQFDPMQGDFLQVREKKTFTQMTGNLQQSKTICYNGETRAAVRLSVDLEKLSPRQKVDLVVKFADLLRRDPQSLKLSQRHSSNPGLQLKESVLMAGPGDADISTALAMGTSTELSWQLSCGWFYDMEDFAKAIEHKAKEGVLTGVLGFDVIGWQVMSSASREERRMRRAVGSPGATPIPGVRATPVATPSLKPTPAVPEQSSNPTVTESTPASSSDDTTIKPTPTLTTTASKSDDTTIKPTSTLETPRMNQMVFVPGGDFKMSTADKEVQVNSFYADVYEVSNAEFYIFWKETIYDTKAEKDGKSLVLKIKGKTAEFEAVEGANWMHPEGVKEPDITKRMDHPVVHVALEDADAYCKWAGKRLSLGVEWEYASTGQDPQEIVWKDGYYQTASVKSGEPNKFGMYNTAGNVWEWAADKLNDDASYLCHENACQPFKKAAPGFSVADYAISNLGFRCFADKGKAPEGVEILESPLD